MIDWEVISRCNRFPNEQVISITVQTNFKSQIDEGEDCREELIKRFYYAVFKVIEEKFSGDEWFEQAVIDELADDWLPEGVEGFSDFGEILLSIAEDSIEVHQRNLSGRELDEFFDNERRSKIPASQKTLLDNGVGLL